MSLAGLHRLRPDRMGYPPPPAPPVSMVRRPVTSSNFDEWCLDPRGLTFEEYMDELVAAPPSLRRAPGAGTAATQSTGPR